MKTFKYFYETGLAIGSSLFESRGEYITTIEKISPEYTEAASPNDLNDTGKVIQELSAVDWSFTSDDTGFLTHDLHPYPTKYIPQIPGNIISRLSHRGELILDPFGGSGTTALEAVRIGRRAVSIDANPVGTIIGKVKTCNLDRTSITDLHAIRCSLAARVNDLPRDPNVLCDEHRTFMPIIP